MCLGEEKQIAVTKVGLLDIDANLGLEPHIFLFSTIVLAQLAGAQAHALLFKHDLNTERLAI